MSSRVIKTQQFSQHRLGLIGHFTTELHTFHSVFLSEIIFHLSKLGKSETCKINSEKNAATVQKKKKQGSMETQPVHQRRIQ